MKTFQSETNLFACLAVTGNNVNTLLNCSHKLNSPALALLASSLQVATLLFCSDIHKFVHFVIVSNVKKLICQYNVI